MIKVHLHNVRAILSRPGYGEGETHAEAIASALEKARAQDPDAVYVADRDVVEFRGVVRL
jgi:pyridoxal/pyridoxine/pyridoxamine kinase